MAAVIVAATSVSACSLFGGADEAAEVSGAGSVTVQESWFVASQGPDTTGYGTIWNQTSQDVTIVAARSDAAGAVQLLDPQRIVVDGLVVPANGYLSLAPDSASLGLMGLTDPVDNGETVSVIVTLQDGSELQLTGQAVAVPGDPAQPVLVDPTASLPSLPS